MTRTPAPKLRRWIDLLTALLRRNFPISLEELCREVPDYSRPGLAKAALRRMFERDKDELRSFGVPIATVTMDGEESGYRLEKQHFYLPYLSVVSAGKRSPVRRVDRYGYKALTELAFEPDELAAVSEALARLVLLGDPTLAEHARSARRKLAFDLPLDAGHDVAVAGVTALDGATFEALGDAVRRRKRVTLRYRAIGNDTERLRTVEPYGLFFLNQHWYLAAAETDGLVRNFRLSRMREVAVNAAQPGREDFGVPAAFSLREHARSRLPWQLGEGPVETARVRIRGVGGAAAAAVRAGTADPDDAQVRVFDVRRRDAFIRWLLPLGASAQPLSPPELMDAWRTAASATLERYRDDA